MLSHSNDRAFTERCAIPARLSGQRREHGGESRGRITTPGPLWRGEPQTFSFFRQRSFRLSPRGVRAEEPNLRLRD